MSECSHDCSSCKENCASRDPASFLEQPHAWSKVKKVIGVVSGKGGVGKSSVTAMLAVLLQRRGLHVGILDADITGPSIPKMFGINKQRATGNDSAIFPVRTKTGIDVISSNLLLEEEKTPLVWRGPVIAGMVKQFWTDVIWEDIDCLLVDMPPGTGDVPLTVFQSIPVDGIIVITSPQDLVSMIVSKAVGMAQMMDRPILGLVENYSYLECPDCQRKIPLFGESHLHEVAMEYHLPVLAQLPLRPEFAKQCDQGVVELFEGEDLAPVCDAIEACPSRFAQE